MPQTESAAFQSKRLLLNTDTSFLELWEFRYSVGTGAFITSNPDPVVFAGVTYSPYPIGRTEIEKDSQGNISDLFVSVANVNRFVTGIAYDVGGTVAILRIVNSALLSTAADCLTERFYVQDVQIGDVFATIRLGVKNPFEIDFPSNKFQRARCRWLPRYGGNECGYDTTVSGALSTCDGTISGANGCTVHGNTEAAAGKPRIHPLRFGGFISIMKGPFA